MIILPYLQIAVLLIYERKLPRGQDGRDRTRTASLWALNRATAERNDPHVAADMLHLADAAQHLGRTEKAGLASRAMRRTRGSDLEAFALQIAADIALQNGLPGIATLSLDQAVISVDETV
jgi:hypothetical protein